MRSSIPMDFGDKTRSDFSFSHLKGGAAYECGSHWHDCFEIFAVLVGYSSPSYFTRKFTEMRGQSPTELRGSLKLL